MLQELTIKTEDRQMLRSLLESAIENEKKMLQIGLDRTRARISAFEEKFNLSSGEFEQKLNTFELDETVEMSEWRMELGMLRLLERQFKTLQDAQLD